MTPTPLGIGAPRRRRRAPARNEFLLRAQDDLEAARDRALGRVEALVRGPDHAADRVEIVERNGNHELPSAPAPAPHDRRDDRPQLRVDRVGHGDLSRALREPDARAALHGEQGRRHQRDGKQRDAEGQSFVQSEHVRLLRLLRHRGAADVKRGAER